jgi:hypothetical protein
LSVELNSIQQFGSKWMWVVGQQLLNDLLFDADHLLQPVAFLLHCPVLGTHRLKLHLCNAELVRELLIALLPVRGLAGCLLRSYLL